MLSPNLKACLVKIRERRAAVAERVWGQSGPQLGLVDVDKPQWLDIDHLLEIIDSRAWMPIETAPKDTTILLGAWGIEGFLQMTGYWADGDWYFIGGGWMGVPPTIWTYLPDPPERT